MEQLQLWITYWYQVCIACIEWVIEYYPIPTIIIGVVITGAMVIGFGLRGQHAEASNILWGTFFGLIACCAMFIVMVMGFGPYLHLQQREKEIKSAAKLNYDAMETSKNDHIKTLNDTMVALQEAQDVLQQTIQRLEKEKSSQVTTAQIDKQQKAAFIKKYCSHEKLYFEETEAAPPLPYDGNRGYAKQIKVWPRFGSSETVIIRINADTVFQLYEKSPDAPEVVTLSGNGHNPNGGYFHEFKLRRGGIKNSPTTITLVNSTSFNVICIDRRPSS